MSNGVIMYTFGERYFLSSIVALNSVRKYYSGNIDFYFINEEPTEEKNKILKSYGVNVKVLNTNLSKNLNSIVKHLLVEKSNFEVSLIMDTDILVISYFDELFDLGNKSFICANSGRTWTETRWMHQEVLKLYPVVDASFYKKPYLNIGFLTCKKDNNFLNYYSEMEKLKNKNTCVDEIVFNVISDESNTKLVNAKYNLIPWSKEAKNTEKAIIIHYHAKSYGRVNNSTNRHTEHSVNLWQDECTLVQTKFKNYSFDLSFI